MATVTKSKARNTDIVKYKDPANGKWVNRWVKKHERTDEVLRECMDIEQGKIRPDAHRVELSDALEMFKDGPLRRSPIGADKRSSSVRREQTAITNFQIWIEQNGYSKFSHITAETVNNYFDSRRDAGIAPKTRKEERRMLMRFYKWAIEERQYCTVNPVVSVPNIKKQKKRPRFFTPDQVRAIIREAQQPKTPRHSYGPVDMSQIRGGKWVYANVLEFMFYTGLRSGEVCNLEWQDWNKNERTLTIRVVEPDSAGKSGNKTKTEGVIPLTDGAGSILEEQEKISRLPLPDIDPRYMRGSKSVRDRAADSKRFIFTRAWGGRLKTDDIYQACKSVLKRLGIEGYPHMMRHSFASFLVSEGVPIYTVKELLRHASVSETEIYAWLDLNSIRPAVAKIPSVR